MLHSILYKLFFFIINMDALLLVLLFLGTILLSTRWWRKGHKLVVTVSLLLFVFVVLPTSQWIGVCLENRFPKLQTIPADTTGIILLGGSFDRPVSAARQEISYNPAAGRLIAFIELARAHSHLKLIFSGGGVEVPGAQSETQMTLEVLKNLGFDTHRLQVEDQSKDTIENARLSFEKFKPHPSEKWLLVTSAYHMPRSVGLFRKAGWNIIPYPVDYHTTGKYEKTLNVSMLRAFFVLHYAMREWAGMINNYVRGYSAELYPAP